MQPALELKPLGRQRDDAALVALVHLRVVGEQQPGRADRPDRLLQQAPVHLRPALELHRGRRAGRSRSTASGWITNTWISAMNRFGNTITCGDPSIMISAALAGAVRLVHRRHVVRHPLLARSEPAERLPEPGGTPDGGRSRCGRRRGPSPARSTSRHTGPPIPLSATLKIERVHELRVIAVGLVLQQHLPVGPDAMLQPARGQLDLAARRQSREPVERIRRSAKVLRQRRTVRRERAEHEPVVALDARHTSEAEVPFSSVPP